MNNADEMKLTSLIVATYDRLPEPELAKLKAVEDRLIRALPQSGSRRPVVSWYGWLVLGLAASGAAAWWAGEFFAGDGSRHDPSPPAVVEQQSTKPDSKGTTTNKKSPNESEKTPTIYRREAY